MTLPKILASTILILIITCASFFPSLENGFNYDDDIYIVNNRSIQTLCAFNLKEICTSFFAGNYQPITILTYALEYRHFNLNPFGYHLTNLLLHLFNCLFVFWLFYLLSKNIAAALLTAIFFAIHPLRVESVAWISERKDLLYASFFLGALISHLYYLKEKSKPGFYLITLGLFLLSLLSKPMAVTLPLVLLLLEYFMSVKINFFNKIPFFLLSLILGVVTLFSQAAVGSLKIGLHDAGDKFLNTAYALIFYLSKIFFPRSLACMYPLPPDAARHSAGIAILCLLLAIVFIRKKLSKDFIFGLTFFLATISVVLPVVLSGETLVSDRYTYIPFLGIGYVVACGILEIFKSKIIKVRLVKITLAMILIFAAAGLSFLTRKQCAVWKDGLTLWSDVLAKYPGLSKAYNNRGVLWLEKKQYLAACADFEKAIVYNPEFIFAYLNLGALYLETGKNTQASRLFEQVVRIDPENAEAYFKLGRIYSLSGRQEEAISLYKKAITSNKRHFLSHYYLAILYVKLGRKEEAVRILNKTIEIAPQETFAYAALDAVFDSPGEQSEKLNLYNKAVKNNADYFNAYYYIGNLFLNSGKNGPAIKLFKRAVIIDAHSAEAYIGLGKAYLAAGKNKESLRALKKALALKRSASQAGALKP